ncbi:hypothetical protein B9Z65_3936 [Elsinoe australis]|uniref:Uncharacterized protein n=1 Tax=Elsinoe australis TaxID=40998 RepID=A0A2P7Z1D3_9PEZI|nr:hypothetical protein B9Z65_3936 [Elsinoe australis]
MHYQTLAVVALAFFGSAAAAPNDLAERSAADRLAMMEARAAHHGQPPLFSSRSPLELTKRDCDCAAFTSCNSGCGAFNNAAGQGGGFCTMSCYSSSGCGENTLCCEDNTSCTGSGCCAGHGA